MNTAVEQRANANHATTGKFQSHADQSGQDIRTLHTDVTKAAVPLGHMNAAQKRTAAAMAAHAKGDHGKAAEHLSMAAEHLKAAATTHPPARELAAHAQAAAQKAKALDDRKAVSK